LDIEVAGDDGVGVGEELSLAVECYLLARGFGLVAGVGGGGEAKAEEKRREHEEKIWTIWLIRKRPLLVISGSLGRQW
jgi:hypothetical protein